jgi:hypothetical protein
MAFTTTNTVKPLLSEFSIIRTFHYPSTFRALKVQSFTGIFVNDQRYYWRQCDSTSQTIKFRGLLLYDDICLGGR